jgi:subtilase family serine protease
MPFVSFRPVRARLAPPASPRNRTPVGVVITGKNRFRALRTRTAVVTTAVLALAAGSVTAATSSMAATSPQASPHSASLARTMAGTHPSWATSAKDQGEGSASTAYTSKVYLAGRNPAGLATYARAVSQPGNASYGKYLSPAQYRARFGPTHSQVISVRHWLTASGLSVLGTDQHSVTVRGTNSQLAHAFGATVHRYKVAGSVLHAPVRDLTVPAKVSSAVLGVSGLTSPGHGHAARPQYLRAGKTAPSGGRIDGLPTTATCSDYFGQKTADGAAAGYEKKTAFDQCPLHPSQLRKAYGITKSGLTGRGARVAIIDAYGSSTMEADANRYAVAHGDRPFAPGQYTEYVDRNDWTNLDQCGGQAGWTPEQSLDVEMVHGLAPQAKVVYVGANSCDDQDLLGALGKVVDNHLADVVSNSWGEIMHSTDGDDTTQGEIAAYEQVFQQAAAEGITVTFSAGDCGDSGPAAAATDTSCEKDTARPQANWPDSDPWVTSVGGTALGVANRSGGYGFETDMGDLRSKVGSGNSPWTPFPGSFYFGGGGGTSEDFAQPWYQAGSVPRGLSHTLMTGAVTPTAKRVTPDVAMDGDLYTAVMIGETDSGHYSESGIGGTSASSPEFAAVEADAIQAHHGPLGFANPQIYARAGLFHDVVDERALHHEAPMSNVVDEGMDGGKLSAGLVAFGQDTSLNAVPGYDDATGVGSPTAAYLRSFG